jgi:hypothetical protein
MKLETLLTTGEMTELNTLVAQAHQAGAGAIRMFIESRSLVVIGIASGGQLLTWFASPAHSLVEAIVTERVVLAGIAAAGTVLNEITNSSAQIATNAIKKAAKFH